MPARWRAALTRASVNGRPVPVSRPCWPGSRRSGGRDGGREAPDQLDGVLRGASRLGAAVAERQLEPRAGGALPEQLELGPAGLVVDGDDHLAQQRPQQFLAIARAGRRCRPQLGQVARDPLERLALGGRERLRS